MRPDLSAGELTLLQSGEYAEHWRVRVENGSGTMVDISGHLKGGTLQLPGPDNPIGTGELRFHRALSDDVATSLAPLVDASDWNKLDDGVTDSPLLQIGRDVTVDLAITALGGARPADVSSDWHEVLGGFAKQPKWPKRHGDVTLEVHDRAYKLKRTHIESPSTYSSGTTIEAAMQALLDDVFGASTYTVVVDDVAAAGSTGSALSVDYQPRVEPVWDALQALASSIGWTCWYRYNASGVAELTLIEPRRDKDTAGEADYTFTVAQIEDVTGLTVIEEDIRNVVDVSYLDSSTGGRETVSAESSASISKYGGIRRYMRIVEEADSPIRTSAAATELRDAALSDLRDPDADVAIETVGAWFAGEPAVDLYVFSAVDQLFDSDQVLAPYSIAIDFEVNQLAKATIRARGRPSGGSASWTSRGGGTDEREGVTLTDPSWRFYERLTSSYTIEEGGTGSSGTLPGATTLMTVVTIGPGTNAVRVDISGGDITGTYTKDYSVTPGDVWDQQHWYSAVIGDSLVVADKAFPRDGTVYNVTLTPYGEWSGSAAIGRAGEPVQMKAIAPGGIDDPYSDAHPASKYYVDDQVSTAFGGRSWTVLSISSGTVTPDWSSQALAVVTLTEDVTIALPSPTPGPGTYILLVRQDGLGPWAIGWNGGYTWPQGTSAPSASGGDDIFTFVVGPSGGIFGVPASF